MADRISSERRSWNMSRIRNKDTKPELVLRSLLHLAGFRYRLHDKKLPGKPDIVLPKYETAIFVNGCFWHRHERCHLAKMPKTNALFWQQKFEATVRRDRMKANELIQKGWQVIVVWECELDGDHTSLMERLGYQLRSGIK